MQMVEGKCARRCCSASPHSASDVVNSEVREGIRSVGVGLGLPLPTEGRTGTHRFHKQNEEGINRLRRFSYSHADAYSGAGTTPSCCSMPSVSQTFQLSTILPPAKR